MLFKGKIGQALLIKEINIAIFDNLDLRKYYVEIDSLRYPRETLFLKHEQNDYIERYKDLKLFFKEYIGEVILNPFVSYPDLKTKYPIRIIDWGHQPDHTTPEKIQLFQDYATTPNNGRLHLISIRRRERAFISHGNNLLEFKVLEKITSIHI